MKQLKQKGYIEKIEQLSIQCQIRLIKLDKKTIPYIRNNELLEARILERAIEASKLILSKQ